MNLLLWIAIILVGHLGMYYFLGTENWVGTALLATSVWAGVLLIARLINRNKQRHGV